MLKDLKVTRGDAKPEDIQTPVGVSERIKNIVEGNAEQPTKPEQPQEDRGDAKRTVEDIVGFHGQLEAIPLDLLEPTPEDWNKFTPISDEKKVLMADSIFRNGLQQPIVVRETESSRGYQILAGNTRTEIFRMLLEITHKDFYKTIPALVYQHDEITDDQAREIVSDTNYIQRAELTKSDRAFAIHTKVDALRKRGASKALEKAAEEFNLERTSVYYWDKIFNLIPELFQMYEDDVFDIIAAARLGSFPQDVQRELYAEKDVLTNEIVKKLSARLRPEQVMQRFHELLEAASRPPQRAEGSWSIRDTSSGYSITVQGKQEPDRKPVLLFLPEKKLKSFMKKYEEYILNMES